MYLQHHCDIMCNM